MAKLKKKGRKGHSKKCGAIKGRPDDKGPSAGHAEAEIKGAGGAPVRPPFNRFPAFMAFSALIAFVVYARLFVITELPFTAYGLLEEAQSFGSQLNYVTADQPLFKALIALEYAVFNVQPLGYFLTAAVLNSICSVLVGVYGRSIIGMRGAVCASWLFALHPLHTDAVASVIGSGELLAVALALLSLIFFTKRGAWRDLSPVLLLLALLSAKTALFVAPVLVLYLILIKKDGLPGVKAGFKSLYSVIPHIIVSLLFIVAFFVSASNGATSVYATYGEKALTQIKVFGMLLRYAVMPVGLNAAHYFDAVTEFLSYGVVVSLQAGILIIFFSVLFWRRAPKVSFLLLMTLLSVLPSVHILTQAELFSESMGVATTIGASLLLGLGFEVLSRRRSIKVAGTLALVPVILLAALTIQRTGVWKDNLTLLTDITVKSDQNARAHYNLGVAYDERGMLREALKEYERAAELLPGYGDAYYNIACAYARLGDIDMALKAIKWAVARGFSDISLLRTDPDLDAIRGEEDFMRLLSGLESGAKAYH